VAWKTAKTEYVSGLLWILPNNINEGKYIIMKKTCHIIGIGIVVLILSGCASIPDMSDEQSEMVSEYAAALMLKYDSENHSRLVSIDNYINRYNEQIMANQTAEEKYYEEIAKEQEAAQKEEENRREETIQQEQASAEYSNSSTPSESANESSSESNSNSETVVVVDNAQPFDDITSISDYIGLSGFDISYVGFSVVGSYGDTKDFAYPVPDGKKLLVLQFSVKNLNNSNNNLDVMKSMVSFKCSVNGDKYISIGTDLSDGNLAYASGDSFSAGETRQYVLIGEIDSNIMPSSLYLKLESPSKKAIVKILR